MSQGYCQEKLNYYTQPGRIKRVVYKKMLEQIITSKINQEATTNGKGC